MVKSNRKTTHTHTHTHIYIYISKHENLKIKLTNWFYRSQCELAGEEMPLNQGKKGGEVFLILQE